MKPAQLARFERKARLLARSEAGRSALAEAGDDWLAHTATVDRTVTFVAEHRTPILLGAGALLLYLARGKPKPRRRPGREDRAGRDEPSAAGWLARLMIVLRLARTLQTVARHLPRPHPRAVASVSRPRPDAPRGLG
ncbi:MAG TPA: YqjK family protein [Plasticicumulans sp.]|nr:YqjK family protein [Plasticicumulans sp.]HNE00977.1 YqjK family protein [Plasticicumulans sp.]